MNMKYLVAGAAIAFLGGTTCASAFPAFGTNPSADVVITFAANGSISTVDNGYGPYDGSDDSYVGIVNNSKNPINKIALTSAACIGCFDHDGISSPTYGAAGNASDTTGYGGPQTFFTNNLGASLTANFIGGIASGSTGYFSLESPPSAINLTVSGAPEPAAWALMMAGVGAIGAALRIERRAGRELGAACV
jgi:hypothetical protein